MKNETLLKNKDQLCLNMVLDGLGIEVEKKVQFLGSFIIMIFLNQAYK